MEPLRQLALVPDGAPVRAQPVAAPFTEISAKAPTPIADRVEPLMMNTQEIAKLTGKMHKHVVEDTRKMLLALGKHWAEFSAEYKDSTGRWLPRFNLPKDLTLTLVSGYNVQMRHRIITRWLELEEASKPAQVVAPRTLEFHWAQN